MSGQIPATFRDFFLHSAHLFRESTALIEQHGTESKILTYGQLEEEINRFSSYLIRSGIKKADPVALLSENRLEWCVASFAVLNIGGILVPLDTNLTAEELVPFLQWADVKILCTSRKFLTIAMMARDLSHLSSMVILCLDPIRPEDSLVEWPEVRQRSYIPFDQKSISVAPEDDAFLVFTSGTTGQPKGVVLSHRNVLSTTWWTLKCGNFVTRETRSFCTIPLFHMYPFAGGLVLPLMAGATVILGSTLKPHQLLVELHTSKPTMLIAVPLILESLYRGILKVLHQKPVIVRVLLTLLSKLSHVTGGNLNQWLYHRVHESFGGVLKYLVSGGAALEIEVQKKLEEIGFLVIQGYGLTETAPVIAMTTPSFRRLGSVGRPLPHLDIRIANPDESGIGEIQVKGDSVMKGYYRAPDLNREAFEDGWFKTGDLGYLDPEGYLFICGRSKDLIVTPAGKKIHPEDLEKIYLKSSWIKEICIFEKTDPSGRYGGLHAAIVPNLEAGSSMDDLEISRTVDQELQAISKDLPMYKRINSFHISREELSKTSLRKTRRHVIKQAQLAVHGTPEGADGTN